MTVVDKTEKSADCTVYILRCSDNSLYTGWTDNLERRIKRHNDGMGAKYTRARRPVEGVYTEILERREQALKRECAIKKLSRIQKIELINKK